MKIEQRERWVAAGYKKCYFPVAGAEVEIPAGLDHKQGWGITNSPNHLKLPISCG